VAKSQANTEKKSRVIIAEVLSSLLQSSGSLSTHLSKYKDHPESSLIQETCYGCCRWFRLLEHILDQFLKKPLKSKDRDIKCLLIAALYQLRELNQAEYAVINESVSAANLLGKPWAKGLVNAVLRNYLRGKDKVEEGLSSTSTDIQYSFPKWLFDQLESQWPNDAESIVIASNERPPLSLRVNLGKVSREQYQLELAEAGIESSPGQYADSSLYLAKPRAVSEIHGFLEGMSSVQDEASQMVVGLLDLQPGLKVLDACAAPGGKTCHILESEHSLTECVAIDMGPRKLERIEENLQRLGLNARLVDSDASDIDNWWDGAEFDRILLDAPCSATAVIRRHPDIKVLRQPRDIEELLGVQANLLTSLWKCLKPGGLLLYTTCSLLKQENEEQISQFLESTDNAKYEGIAADWGVECRFGRQLLPGDKNGPDGFFYCPLRKSQS
jgi:16S rRNA (cytosine967-C5)-methyltransferase